MAKISKEQQWRMEGIGYAIRFMEDGKSFEELKADARMRGAYNMPLSISKADYDEFAERAASVIAEGFMLMTCMVLRTEFKFGKSRIERFKQAYEDRAEDLIKGFYGWEDLRYLIDEELGIERNKS